MITLQNKDIELQLNPNLGAAVHCLKYQGQDILRPTADVVQAPQQQSMFVMIPYCSIIKGGRFNYFGISRHVPANQSQMLDPIHGDAWLQAWQTVQFDATSATFCYHHTKDQGFPFDYTATVVYTLQDNQVQITLSLYNPFELPMPCGFGIHPYFLHPDKAMLSFKSSHIWYHKQDPIFDRPYPTPKQWDFSKPCRLMDDFDTAFGGWDGVARITYPDQRIQIDLSAPDIFHHILIYAPKGSDFFCLEPISNTPDAFNLAANSVIGTGIQSLGPHQTLCKTITFRLSRL